jgi:NDP-sugar pyrophosphorylase family protein
VKAMIFAAGLGTRLKPITNNKPKAMVEVAGKPLLGYAIEKLANAGCNQIIINVHHFADQIVNYIESNDFGVKIFISDETEKLLDTGGGLKKAEWFFDDGDPFIVFNVDVFTDLNLQKMLEFHQQSNAMATLAVRNRETSRYLLFNPGKQLIGWTNKKTNEFRFSRNEENYSEMAFSGIHIINPEIFSYIKQDGKFSMIDVYLELAKIHTIMAYDHSNSFWMDLGKHDQLEKIESLLKQNPNLLS